MRVLRVVLAAFALLALAPGTVGAVPSLSPPCDGQVLLGFGEAYSGSRVHSGLDIAAESGGEVEAPADGTVTFAGRLPSADGEALAVTITTADGFKVTCLPLAELRVTKGETVGAGTTLGELAGEGDSSSAGSHVHLSVREGESYLDPAKLMPAPPALAPEPEPETVSAPEASAGGAPADAPSPAVASAAEGIAGDIAGSASAPSGASRPADSPEAPLSAASAVQAVSSCGTALRTASAVPHPRAAAFASGVPALDVALRLFARLRALATALAAFMVAAACLWPVWRRVSTPVCTAEVAPVRARS